jgi:hypothetical protein
MFVVQHALPSEEGIDELFGDLNMTNTPPRSASALPVRSWQGRDGSPLRSSPAARRLLITDPKMRRRRIEKQHTSSPMLMRPTKLRDPSACRDLAGSRQNSFKDMMLSSGLLFSCSGSPTEQILLEEQHEQLLQLAQQQCAIVAELSALRAQQDGHLQSGVDDLSAGYAFAR